MNAFVPVRDRFPDGLVLLSVVGPIQISAEGFTHGASRLPFHVLVPKPILVVVSLQKELPTLVYKRGIRGRSRLG